MSRLAMAVLAISIAVYMVGPSGAQPAPQGVPGVQQPPPPPRPPRPSGGQANVASQDPRRTEEILADAAERFERFKTQKDMQALNEILALLKIVLARDPLNTEANLLHGEAAIEANDYDSARDYLRSVLQVEPNNYRANVGLGKIWNANKSWRQAIMFFETAERVAPDAKRGGEVKKLLAQALAGMGDVPKAIDKIQEAMRLQPDDLDALDTLVQIRAVLATRDRSFAAAAVADADAYLQRCKQLAADDPGNEAALRRLSGAYDTMIDIFRQLHNSFYEQDSRNQPTNRVLQDKEPDAAAALVRITELLSEQALVQLTLRHFEILKISGEPATTLDPKNIKALELLAGLYRQTSNPEKAVETAKRILEIDPAHKSAREFLQSMGQAPANSPVSTQPAAAAGPTGRIP